MSDEGISLAENKPILQEAALSRDVLHHTLAFKGFSLDIFNDTVEEVKILISEGADIYPPEFPLFGDRNRASTLKKEPLDPSDGRLAPAEAVGVRVLQQEALALLQVWGKNPESGKKLDKALGTGRGISQTDALEGILEFANLIEFATGVRERILRGEGEPSGETIADDSKLHWDRLFRQPLEEDKLRIGVSTTTKAVEEAPRDILKKNAFVPERANEAVTKTRIAGRVRGAELAKALYLEAVDLASHILPADLDRQVQSLR